MEILVKHPKAPGNKSEFLKALRNEKKDLEENDGEFNDRSNCTNKEEVNFSFIYLLCFSLLCFILCINFLLLF